MRKCVFSLLLFSFCLFSGCKTEEASFRQVHVSGMQPPNQPQTHFTLELRPDGTAILTTSSLAGGYNGPVIQEGSWRQDQSGANVTFNGSPSFSGTLPADEAPNQRLQLTGDARE